ncbi:hypothetical protein C1Y08_27355 [Pseudomonas sp. FW306-02-F02-AA]|uniref:Uncharacterized protein n=1 Tax=Pseudomonas fluorescens TaxID=294 RepID=A0A0N9WP31_PSEFL|nr:MULTISPECIES: hypothetical protein [Pseudomonas]ALI03709.1 hypothetical protein AO353_22520 [Pseudomonas fluorescens]PMZ01789.1 hypothetical protein C1Y07_23500 [Pseudomonas sp. FW306-02-F02-AB]PMZ06899.1 hypothetical protein C1Y06_27375 [Pseudomonas sp. FW306-02-H06C]PMZ12750.1 hypothetical protein C1Y08_27355 [Pseudomonas sp. FW306-02-F02-AA]PMZ19408.1 hypothetical protein C1Y09_24005 [Pseudomonas sp. FW306-02-F08-AA]
MSTLNEIAANHARMAKANEEESTGLSERHLQIVGSFEIPAIDAQQHIPLHLIAGVQDNHFEQATGYLL